MMTDSPDNGLLCYPEVADLPLTRKGIAWTEDHTRFDRASLWLTLGREMFLHWSVHYTDRDDAGKQHPIHRVGRGSPSPFHAARRLRALRGAG